MLGKTRYDTVIDQPTVDSWRGNWKRDKVGSRADDHLVV